MTSNPWQVKPKRLALPLVSVSVPPELSSSDLRSAASALDDLCDDLYRNGLSGAERMALADVAVWLRRAAKEVEPRDLADWDAVQAVREDRETRAANQLVACRHGVGEATVREASAAARIAKRRIVR